ncbi:MAG: hypothetical protein KDB14_09900 [Planctomycetales bacterium]|nr:hypothetical protein [Planctomycetales bacterium]
MREIAWLQSIASAELDVARKAFAAPHWNLTSFPSLGALLAKLGEQPFRMVAMAQPRRGVWTNADCEQVIAAAPLARLMGVHGSWCEGWQRTGHPWTGAEHCYWHQVPLRVRRWSRELTPPATLSFAEQLGWSWNSNTDSGLVAGASISPDGPATERGILVSAAAAHRAALGDALASLGWRLLQPDDAQRAVGVIWDGDVRIPADCRRLEQLIALKLPTLAVTCAPRLQDWQALANLGASVLTKPYWLADLRDWLELPSPGSGD